MTDAEATAAALETLLDAGPIQILVNNAGIHDDAVMPGMRREQWTRVIDVSLNGFFNVTQPLLMPMIGTRWGRIVNCLSVAADRRQPRADQLRGGQGRAAWSHEVAGAGTGAARHHRQCRGTGHHRLPHGGSRVRSRRRSSGWSP